MDDGGAAKPGTGSPTPDRVLEVSATPLQWWGIGGAVVGCVARRLRSHRVLGVSATPLQWWCNGGGGLLADHGSDALGEPPSPLVDADAGPEDPNTREFQLAQNARFG